MCVRVGGGYVQSRLLDAEREREGTEEYGAGGGGQQRATAMTVEDHGQGERRAITRERSMQEPSDLHRGASLSQKGREQHQVVVLGVGLRV